MPSCASCSSGRSRRPGGGSGHVCSRAPRGWRRRSSRPRRRRRARRRPGVRGRSRAVLVDCQPCARVVRCCWSSTMRTGAIARRCDSCCTWRGGSRGCRSRSCWPRGRASRVARRICSGRSPPSLSRACCAPAVLSVAAVGELVQASLGSPDERFVLACHDATGGNPFLTRELLGALAATRSPVGGRGRRGERAWAAHRPARDRAAVGAVAAARRAGWRRPSRCWASGARLRDAAALAGLDEREASAAADALAAVEILRARLPLEFVHPIVRSAVYDELAPAARSLAHARAARLLAAERADAEQVAAHLLACEPASEPSVVDQLRTAASRRLRAAPPRPRACISSGRWQSRRDIAGSSVAAVRARAGRGARARPARDRAAGGGAAAERGACVRVRIASELFGLLLYAGQWDAAIALVDRTLHELGDLDADGATRLETMRAAMEAYDPRLVRAVRSRPRATASACRRRRARRRDRYRCCSACSPRWRVDGIDQAAGLVERGLDGDQLLADEQRRSVATAGDDRADRPRRARPRGAVGAGRSSRMGRRRGSVFGVSAGSSFLGWVHAQRGALRDAEAEIRVGFGLAVEHGLTFALPSIFRYALDVHARAAGACGRRGARRGDRASTRVRATRSPARCCSTYAPGCDWLRGEVPAAIADLRRCGEIFDAVHFTNPVMSPGARRSRSRCERPSRRKRHGWPPRSWISRAPPGCRDRSGSRCARRDCSRAASAGSSCLRDAVATLQTVPERARAWRAR